MAGVGVLYSPALFGLYPSSYTPQKIAGRLLATAPWCTMLHFTAKLVGNKLWSENLHGMEALEALYLGWAWQLQRLGAFPEIITLSHTLALWVPGGVTPRSQENVFLRINIAINPHTMLGPHRNQNIRTKF